MPNIKLTFIFSLFGSLSKPNTIFYKYCIDRPTVFVIFYARLLSRQHTHWFETHPLALVEFVLPLFSHSHTLLQQQLLLCVSSYTDRYITPDSLNTASRVYFSLDISPVAFFYMDYTFITTKRAEFISVLAGRREALAG